MNLLKFNLSVPFWCSFAEYGTLNIQQTYLIPPPTALFGMILNAMGKPSVHTISDENARENLEQEYLEKFSELRFSILVRNPGEKIDDYLNILKGSRESENIIAQLLDEITKSEIIMASGLEKKKLKELIGGLISQTLETKDLDKELIEITGSDENAQAISLFLKEKCTLSSKKRYDFHKRWGRSQIHRQRLLQPRYGVYIQSDADAGEFSLRNISRVLRDPRRSLYLGESDDLVDLEIENEGIVTVENEYSVSSRIDSVIPGPKIFENCQITKIPRRLRFDTKKEQKIICSIPQGPLKEEIACIRVSGENIVFL